MKRLNLGMNMALSVVLLISIGCASSGSTSQESNQATHNYTSNYWTLEDFLRRANGVQLQKHRGETYIKIRGNNSLGNPDNQPLFVVDGQKAGRSFSQVASMFVQGDIVSVTVLPPGSSSQYGMEGNYGVIEVQSKMASVWKQDS